LGNEENRWSGLETKAWVKNQAAGLPCFGNHVFRQSQMLTASETLKNKNHRSQNNDAPSPFDGIQTIEICFASAWDCPALRG
jgi:hypothetical protein